MGEHQRAGRDYPAPIPTRPSPDQVDEWVGNVVSAWRAARVVDVIAGRQWYPCAHRLAVEVSGGDVRAGAGVLAALSPQVSWPHTVTLARRAFADGRASGHFSDACRKADQIMLGADPACVLPRSKTGDFFRCILDPGDREPVVIDRHAHDVAVGARYGNGPRGLDSARRYATLADCYRMAADVLGETPSVVQAVTWVAHISD